MRLQMCAQDAIKKPLIRTESKLVKREASEIFRLIQMYMGDRPLVKSGLTPAGIAADLVCRGWTNVALRDEIYIQLCRQTTRNPLPSVAAEFTLCLLSGYCCVVSLCNGGECGYWLSSSFPSHSREMAPLVCACGT